MCALLAFQKLEENQVSSFLAEHFPKERFERSVVNTALVKTKQSVMRRCRKSLSNKNRLFEWYADMPFIFVCH